jgi:lysozyme family protein
MNFDQAIARVLPLEGGWVNNPADPGGETNFGITWPTLHEAIAQSVVPVGTTISGLTRDLAVAIYKALFWDAGQMDQYDGAIGYQVLDFAVNSGISNALRALQRAAGVPDDGKVGPVTVAAIKGMPVPKMLALFIAERGAFWAGLSIFPKFGAGWMNRMVADIRFAVVDWQQENTPP